MAKFWAPGMQKAQREGQNLWTEEEERSTQNTHSGVQENKYSAIYTAPEPCPAGGRWNCWKIPDESKKKMIFPL